MGSPNPAEVSYVSDHELCGAHPKELGALRDSGSEIRRKPGAGTKPASGHGAWIE